LRKKRLFKIGIYAYVALLFAGASYALFRGVPVEFVAQITAYDARPPLLVTTPSALLPTTSPGAFAPIVPPPGVATTSPAAVEIYIGITVPGMNLLNTNQIR
jgi:hypothetical protein